MPETSASEETFLFNLNMGRSPLLGVVTSKLYLLLCPRFDLEHADLFLYLFAVKFALRDQSMTKTLSQAMSKALVCNMFPLHQSASCEINEISFAHKK